MSFTSIPQLCQPLFLIEGQGEMTSCLNLTKPWKHYIVVDRDNAAAFKCTNQQHLGGDGSWDRSV